MSVPLATYAKKGEFWKKQEDALSYCILLISSAAWSLGGWSEKATWHLQSMIVPLAGKLSAVEWNWNVISNGVAFTFKDAATAFDHHLIFLPIAFCDIVEFAFGLVVRLGGSGRANISSVILLTHSILLNASILYTIVWWMLVLWCVYKYTSLCNVCESSCHAHCNADSS